jgi:hypothetical protein
VTATVAAEGAEAATRSRATSENIVADMASGRAAIDVVVAPASSAAAGLTC